MIQIRNTVVDVTDRVPLEDGGDKEDDEGEGGPARLSHLPACQAALSFKPKERLSISC